MAVTLAGAPARALSPADLLVQACVEAMAAGAGAPLQWVCDAWFLAARGLAWGAVADVARRARLERPLAVVLAHLALDLGAPIPPSALEALGPDRPGLGDLDRGAPAGA